MPKQKTLDVLFDFNHKNESEVILYRTVHSNLVEILNKNNKVCGFGIDKYRSNININTVIYLDAHGSLVSNSHHIIKSNNLMYKTVNFIASLAHDISTPLNIQLKSCYSGALTNDPDDFAILPAGTSIVTSSSCNYMSDIDSDIEDIISINKYSGNNRFINFIYSILLSAEQNISFIFTYKKNGANKVKIFTAKIPLHYISASHIIKWQNKQIKLLKNYYEYEILENCSDQILKAQLIAAINYINNCNHEIAIIQKDNIQRVEYSLLFTYINQNKRSSVSEFIKSGVNVNTPSIFGRIPLHTASKAGHKWMVKFLLDSGADVNITKSYDGTSSLYAASQFDHEEVVRLLLDNGADVNKVNNDGVTPLIIATINGNEKVVKILLNNDADVNKAENNSITPLIAASQFGHEGIARLLLDNGADINKVNNDGVTPLIIATINGNEKIVKILLNNGADVNKAEDNAIAPLIAASQFGHEEIARLLLDNGADINILNNIHGLTPLIAASIRGHEMIVRLLLNNGADINKSIGNEKPLDFAIHFGHKKIVNLIHTKCKI